MTLRLSLRAERDIEDIRSNLIARSPQGADRVRAALASDMEILERFPYSGRATDFAEIRILPVVRYPYLIYYTVASSEVVIVHVRHSSRGAPDPRDLR